MTAPLAIRRRTGTPLLLRQSGAAPRPGVMGTCKDYLAWLSQPLGLYESVERRLGGPIASATRFHAGRDQGAGPTWQRLQGDRNRFGEAYPHRLNKLGTTSTFQSVLTWPAPYAAC